MNEEMCNQNIPQQPRLNVGIGAACEPLRQQYDINIVHAENGFIVRVGCKVFVFAEWVLASEALALYFKSPEEAIKKYCH